MTGSYEYDPRFAFRLCLTIFTFAVSYFGIRQPTLFTENESRIPEKARYGRSGLNDKSAADYAEKIHAHMKAEKPFLNPELTLNDVADHLHISRHHITQVLNEHIQKNFYTYINEYRLEEIKKRLIDPAYQSLTLLAIAYDCGFNSKSAFNSIFKKSTGMTPSEYRKNHNSD
jgi:AraC-like DNA-binding protein